MCVLLVSNSLQKHKIYFTKFVADNSNDLLDEPSTPGYSNEALHSDVSEQINQYASNSSLLYEVSFNQFRAIRRTQYKNL